jgi:gamma-glutamylcyclotransferase (GGCT)/AIG2-like uncharacterized protein YtfP
LVCTRLFVYGTLRRAFQNPYAKLLSENATFLGAARIPGRLYRVRHFPGVRLSLESDEWVVGELYELRDPASMLATLDEYEGSNRVDRPPEFQRVLTTAILEGGAALRAWIYVYNWPVAEERRILSGDFLEEQ